MKQTIQKINVMLQDSIKRKVKEFNEYAKIFLQGRQNVQRISENTIISLETKCSNIPWECNDIPLKGNKMFKYST